MQVSQNIMDSLIERVRQGELTADQANVEKVRAQRVYLVTSRIPMDVRKALNAAVKSGQLKRIKRDGNKPEAYFHPEFDYMVAGARNAHVRSIAEAVSRVACAGGAA